MKRIRVLVANQPRLMRELIMATIADQPDIELASEVGKQDDLADAVAQTRPDVLILAMDDCDKYRLQCGISSGQISGDEDSQCTEKEGQTKIKEDA